MRYLIDTHIFIWSAKEKHKLSPVVRDILGDYSNDICVSSETLKELVQVWHSKPLMRQWWKTPMDAIRAVEEECYFRVLYLHKEHYETYAKLQINEAQEHHDASDHLIISHALTNRIPLISADRKFGFYRNQGLELIEN